MLFAGKCRLREAYNQISIKLKLHFFPQKGAYIPGHKTKAFHSPPPTLPPMELLEDPLHFLYLAIDGNRQVEESTYMTATILSKILTFPSNGDCNGPILLIFYPEPTCVVQLV
jgi:hypothetical protein